MTLNCQEAMADGQAPERVAAPVGGASISTIESLRARLLSERAASKEARQHAHNIALKVSDLQSRLDAEIEHRKKAELAMKEVLEVLIAKGVAMEEVMAAAPSLSGSSDSGETVQVNNCDSEHSSGEEASQEYIGSHQGSGSEETQIMLADSLRTEAEKEGMTAGKDSPRADSSEVEINFGAEIEEVTAGKDCLRADRPEVETTKVTMDEDRVNPEQILCTESLEKHPHALLNEVGEENNNIQTLDMPCDTAKHLEESVLILNDCKPDIYSANRSPSQLLEKAATPHQGGESNMAPTVSLLGGHQLSCATPKEGVSSHAGDVEKSKGLDENSVPVTHIYSGFGDKGAHGIEGSHPVDDKMARGLTPRDMAPPVSTMGLGHNGMHHGLFPRHAYSYEQLYMNPDPLQHMQYVPVAEAPFARGPMSTAYPGRKHLSSDAMEFGRYPQAPVSDAILSLVDDKNGKLGSILMALNLAKQQISDEEYPSSHTDEVYEAAFPSPFFGKPYPALYECVPYQPPYHPWRPDLHNQAPIVHLPMSPTSDHETSAFERHDGIKRSSSIPAYYMPGHDSYLQPKGELHLGNGITLYTD